MLTSWTTLIDEPMNQCF